MTGVFTKCLYELSISGNAAFKALINIIVVEVFSTPYILWIITLILLLALWFSQWWYSDRTAAVNVHIVPVHLHRRASVSTQSWRKLSSSVALVLYVPMSVFRYVAWLFEFRQLNFPSRRLLLGILHWQWNSKASMIAFLMCVWWLLTWSGCRK